MIDAIKKTVISYKSFFFLYAAFLLILGTILLMYSKEETFLFVNNHYSSWADSFFKGVTGLGDGLFFVLVTLALALYRYRLALLGIIVFLSSSLLAQLLKHTLFSSFKRPYGVLGQQNNLHIVEGITLHTNNSFPSGHTTTAFALTLFLVLAFQLRRSGWLLAIAAILVGYSRVYLVQHFPVDVYFGSLLGVISCMVFFNWLDEPFKMKFGDKGLMSKS